MTADTEKYRFRTFLESLVKDDEIEIIKESAPLSTIASRLEGNTKATWFRSAGPEGQELAGNVMGSRRRIAKSLGLDEADLLSEVINRLRAPLEPVEINGQDAPVQKIVLREEEADLTSLPCICSMVKMARPIFRRHLIFRLILKPRGLTWACVA